LVADGQSLGQRIAGRGELRLGRLAQRFGCGQFGGERVRQFALGVGLGIKAGSDGDGVARLQRLVKRLHRRLRAGGSVDGGGGSRRSGGIRSRGEYRQRKSHYHDDRQSHG
jgi:hypothetical protein